MTEVEKEILHRLRKIESASKVRQGWITGYVNLGRYLGWSDPRGRKAKKWALAEGIYTKFVNGTPSWRLVDIDRHMSNGKRVELGDSAGPSGSRAA